MNEPLVSVVMCTYNGSKFIDEQIESILSQDYGNIELIISDDVSTDDTWDKLVDWQHKNSLIKIFKNDLNIGYNKNFEKAIKLANGEFIALSDQDDIWMPNKISSLIKQFENKKITLAHSRSVRLQNGRLRFKSASLHHHFKGNDTRKLFMFNQVNGHDIMFKKDLKEKILPLPEGVMYDWWIAVVATCYGEIASVNKYLVHHRIHEENNFFNDKTNSKKKQTDLVDVLKIFSFNDALSPKSRSFLNAFLHHLIQHNKKQRTTLDYTFFSFLFKHRKIFFGHNRRWMPQWNYLKKSLKYARFNFTGKGITF